MDSRIHIGTSGWSYDWPELYHDTPYKDRLSAYSARFDTVEVNYSFRRLPKKNTIERWMDETERNLLFSMKMSRYVTHMKRLRGVKEPVRRFIRRYMALEEEVRGPILVQIQGNFTKDGDTLDYFFATLFDVALEFDCEPRVALEVRDTSWFEKDIYDMLSDYGVALVFSHTESLPYPVDEPLTADFVYLRLHGPKEFAASEYGTHRLRKWAEKVKEWRQKTDDVFIYFNNDKGGHAPTDAERLIELL